MSKTAIKVSTPGKGTGATGERLEENFPNSNPNKWAVGKTSSGQVKIANSALTKMSGRTTNNIQEIVGDLKQYVALYQQMNGGALPPNMGVIYDYMQDAGELNWSASPVANVRNVGQTAASPVTINPPASATTTTTARPAGTRKP